MSDEVSRMLIEVKVENGEASVRELRKVGGAAKDAGEDSAVASKKVKEHSEAYSKLSTAATAASLGGIALVTGGMYESAKAGVKWQQQMAKITQALKNNHAYSKGAAKEVGALAEKSAEHGGFGAEEQLEGFTQFLNVTHNRQKAIEANTAAENLARQTGQGYAQSQKMVAMALAGSTGRLERQIGYIPKVTEATKKLSEQENQRLEALRSAGIEKLSNQERAQFERRKQEATQADKLATTEKALAVIRSKTAGGMAAYSHTFSGMASNMKQMVENIERQFGTELLPSLMKVAKLIISGFGWLLQHKTVLDIIIGLAGAIWIASTALTAYNAVMGITNTLMTVFAAESLLSWGLIVLAILAVAAVIVLIITHFGTVKRVASDVFSFVLRIIKTVWNWIKSNWPLLLAIITGPFGMAVYFFLKFKKQIIGIFQSVVHWITTAFHNLLTFLESIPGKIVNAFKSLPGKLGGILSKIPGVSTAKSVVGSIGSAIGLNHGGMVPHLAFAPGGIVPGYGSSDTVPAMLTPGEFIMRKQATSAIGTGTLERMNQTGGLGGADTGGDQYVPIQIINKLDSRVLSESTTKYALKKQRAL
jgi:hypothetical protein